MTLDAAPAAHAAVADDPRLDRLVPAAIDVMHRAYAPYSRFRVGAALLTRGGDVFVGCNVENASYPASICAERGAVMTAVAAGRRDFELIVIATEAAEPTPPCGQCRQVLAEFAPTLEVVSVVRGVAPRRWTMDELLPSPFLPDSLREQHGSGSLTDDR